jgi:hypothetical protein
VHLGHADDEIAPTPAKQLIRVGVTLPPKDMPAQIDGLIRQHVIAQSAGPR